jgi:hypothetical protein
MENIIWVCLEWGKSSDRYKMKNKTIKELLKLPVDTLFTHPLVLSRAMINMDRLGAKYLAGEELTGADRYDFYQAKEVLFTEFSKWPRYRVGLRDKKRFAKKAAYAERKSRIYKRDKRAAGFLS